MTELSIPSRGAILETVPVAKYNTAPVSAVGAVAEGQLVPMGNPMAKYMSFTLNNAAGTVAKSYILFDSLGLVQAAVGGTNAQPDSGTVPMAAIKEAIKGSPIATKSIQYNINTGTASQFAQSFRYARAGVGGESQIQPIYLERGRRNTAQNEKLLTMEQNLLLDQFAGLLITVEAGTSVTIGFEIAAQFNAF